jgi:peptide/nickel transport system substrate-binding protein
MPRSMLWTSIWSLLAALFISACAVPASGPARDDGGPARPSHKRITAAITGDPYTLNARLNTSGPGSNVPGTDVLEDIVAAGLANTDPRRELRAELAERVPTIENGLWKVLPDGTMETIWRIKPGSLWHDGTPFTADDLVFTAAVGRDRELPWEYDTAFDFVAGVDALDPNEIRVRWKGIFAEANTLFSRASGRTVPLPKHLLSEALGESKAAFFQHPYWGTSFVGTGPFRLRDWVPGSHMVLEANDRYILGRPKIDEIEVRFIKDPRTLVVNILGGSVELTLGRGLSLEQATQIRDQWSDGKMVYHLSNWIVIYPQFLNSNPVVVGNVDFRRALLHAIDRQQIIDGLQAGIPPVGHGYLSPDDPDFRDTESAIVRYEYDPARARRLLEGLGYALGPDGTFRSSLGERLSVEIRAGGGDDLAEKATLSVADFWERIGVATEPIIMSPQRVRDRDYSATFPGFYLRQNPNDAARLGRFHSSRTPLPENRFTGDNNPRYMNAEFDSLVERYAVSLSRPERIDVLKQLIHIVSDQVVFLGLFFNLEPTMVANRLRNIGARVPGSTQAWNADEWEAL